VPIIGEYHKSPKIVVKKKYIKVAPRKLLVLPKIADCEITDYHKIDEKYFAVNVLQWAKCTKVSQKKTRRIVFYEKQNRGIQ
jgi:hypothetical protein